jgi:hypothetical protein
MTEEGMQRIQQLEKRRDQLRESMVGLGDLRQGSLLERYIPCGKASCRCHDQKPAGHGPYYSLTRAIKGKTKTRLIPANAVALAREQLAEFQKFRELSRRFLEVSEQLCEARLGMGMKNPEEAAAKKKPSKRR